VILAAIPFVCEPDAGLLESLATGGRVRVDADRGRVDLLD